VVRSLEETVEATTGVTDQDGSSLKLANMAKIVTKVERLAIDITHKRLTIPAC
jgi:hypothetical protein